MHSMTGFGAGKCIIEGREISVELKSVNHRFLDINHKMPKSLSFMEASIREVISGRLSRGHVELFLIYNNTREDSKKIEMDEGLLNQYVTALKQAGEKVGIGGEITYGDIFRMQDVLKVTEEEDDKEAILNVCGS